MAKRNTKTRSLYITTEPKWKELKLLTDPEEQAIAFKSCEYFVRTEINKAKYMPIVKKWVKDHSGWSAEESKFILSEGLGDYFKQGLKFIKDTFTDLIVKAKNKIKNFSGGIVKKLSMKTTKPTPKLNSFMKKRFNTSSKLIKEAKQKYSYNAYAEMCSKLANSKCVSISIPQDRCSTPHNVHPLI